MLNNQRKAVGQLRELLGNVAPPQQFDHLKGLPFYNWPAVVTNDSKCEIISHYQSRDFNHAIGLPQKNDQLFPLFDYEQLLYDTLQSNKHVWIKKATGLGVTEFMLRYMAWLCFQSSEKARKYQNINSSNRDTAISGLTSGLSTNEVKTGSQMCIVTGPRIELAITLIDRMKALFRSQSAKSHSDLRSISFDTKETVIELNGVHIEAYPSHHLDAMRGLTNVSFIYLDEADFFPPGQQQDARDVSERYIGKSNPWIVMVSTPNAPEGLFERIEKEPESTCLYKRLFLDYTYGLNRIYTQAEIDAAKQSPSFEREYNLKYLGLIGNVFHTKDIEAAIERGKQIASRGTHFSPEHGNSYTQKSVGLDPGFGSSNFGVCITELRDGLVHVLHAEEYHRPDFNSMITTTVNLLDEYDITFEGRSRIFVDGANPSFISALKDRVNEDSEYDKQIAFYKHNYPSVYDLEFLEQNMFVIPVAFNKEHKHMLAHCKAMMEYQNGQVAIHPRFNKLITSLRTAVEKRDGSLDKEATSHDDCFDAFRMSLIFWH